MKSVGVIAGGVAGALVCGVVTLVIWFTLYQPPGHDNWDFASPIIIFGTSIVSALLGAAGGAYVGLRLAAGDTSAWRVAALIGGLAVIAPVVLYVALFVVLPRLPVREDRTPATSRERRQWIKDKQGVYFDERSGLQLAFEIDDCAGGRTLRETYLQPCGSLARSRAHQAPEPPHWYTAHDSGWRWMDTTYEDQHHIVIFPDPLSGRSGPVFEVRENGLIVRRETADAPAFAVREDLAVADAFRRCLLATAPRARSEGAWDGDWASLLRQMPTPRCEGLAIVSTAERNTYGPARARVRFAGSHWGPFDIEYEPMRDERGGFQLRGSAMERRYLIDRDGGWHVSETRSRRAEPFDPPPPACAIDLRRAC
jgi:hypothetical protein